MYTCVCTKVNVWQVTLKFEVKAPLHWLNVFCTTAPDFYLFFMFAKMDTQMPIFNCSTNGPKLLTSKVNSCLLTRSLGLNNVVIKTAKLTHTILCQICK